MKALAMQWRDRAAEIAAVERRTEVAAVEGATYGPKLLAETAGVWRRMMRSDPRCRSYGTLRFLLERAREKFDNEPTVARELTAAILDFVDAAKGPSHIHEIGLRALARKEYANACLQVGDLSEALSAAERSVEIYGEASSLLFDQTRARLVICKVLREMGETERALAVARKCGAVFRDFGELPLMNMARMFEGGALFASKQFAEALHIFTEVMAQAEMDGDRLTVARCLHCGASCARELGKLDSARDLYPRALAIFEDLGLQDDANCVRWGYALLRAAEGRTAAAVSELYKVRAVFLRLGMNSQAASAALDIVRLRFDASEDVSGLCSELVTTFTAAGMAQNAIESLAYLREQAREGTLTTRKIARLRTYFGELPKQPNLLFVRPLGEEGA